MILVNKFRAVLTMLGMVIGVFAVVSLIGLGQGAKRYVLSEFQSLGANMIIIQPGKTEEKGAFHAPIGSASRRMTESDVQAIEKQSLNVVAVSGLVLATGEVRYGSFASNGTILGGSDQFNEIINVNFKQGEFFSKQDADVARRVVVLGHTIAETLFGTEYAVGRSVLINSSKYRVVGVLKKFGNKLGLDIDLVCFIPTKAALRLFNEDRLFGIRAKARAKVAIQDAVDEITAILKERRRGEEDFTIVTQVSMMNSLGNILSVLTYILGSIAAISMLVGGIGIMNIMLVNVNERIPEIGIRRAVGATSSDILQQFLLEALMLSVLSGMFGVVGAVSLLGAVGYFFPIVDLVPSSIVLILTFVVAVVIGILFGVWPAYRAAQIETLDALRYE
jgi:putative ABC transport system permease protein